MIIALSKRWSTKPWKHDHFIPQAWSLSSWKDDQNNHETMIMMYVQVIHRNPWLPRSWFVDPLLLWVFRGCGSMIKLRLFHLSLPSIVAKLAKRLKWRQFGSLASKIAWLSELTEAWSWKTLCLVCRYCISSFRRLRGAFMLQSPIPSAFSRKWRIKKHASEKPTCLIIFPRNGSMYSSLDLPSFVHYLPWSCFRIYSYLRKHDQESSLIMVPFLFVVFSLILLRMHDQGRDATLFPLFSSTISM